MSGSMSQSLLAVIQRYRIRRLWHFTDEANLPSIRQHGGILSLNELTRRGIAIPMPGGDGLSHHLDRERGLDRYVHLCFRMTHPMEFRAREEGRISKTVWIGVDASVMLDPDVRFSAGVSYQEGIEIVDHERAARELDFEVIYSWMDWTDPEIQKRRQVGEKTEILVPNMVPLHKLKI
jgi:hypothetical protein